MIAIILTDTYENYIHINLCEYEVDTKHVYIFQRDCIK